MKPELEKIEDGIYKWNLIPGNKYFLGYHHGTGPHNMWTKPVYARFFGNLEGQHKFFRMEEDKVFSYSSNCSNLAVWFGDFEDGPCFPGVHSGFDGEVEPGLEKGYLVKILKKYQ